MRILVTGASGLLGVNLAIEAAQHHQVFGVVHSTLLRTDDFDVLVADLLQPGAVERLVKQVQPDWVIHCAAMANVDECERKPKLARRINSELPGILAEICRKGGARLLHVSTDAVFDGQSGNYTEEDEPLPLSVYAQTKLAGEQAVANVYPEAIIARVNFYGWSVSGTRSLAEWFLSNLRARQHIKGFTDVFFCPLLANDLAQIFMRMLEAGLCGLYHVVSPESLSKYAFGVALARQFGLEEQWIEPASVSEVNLRAPRSPRLTLSVDKLLGALGESLPSIASGLKHFHSLYLQGYPQYLSSLVEKS